MNQAFMKKVIIQRIKKDYISHVEWDIKKKKIQKLIVCFYLMLSINHHFLKFNLIFNNLILFLSNEENFVNLKIIFKIIILFKLILNSFISENLYFNKNQSKSRIFIGKSNKINKGYLRYGT